MNIAIVSTSTHNHAALAEMLSTAGYGAIHPFDSVQAAVEALRERADLNVDLVLLDEEWLGSEGVEACRWIRGMEHLQDTPIIMVFDHANVVELEAALAAGVTDCIIRPFSRAELLMRVRSALSLQRERMARKAWEERVTRELSLARTVQQGLLSPPLRERSIAIEALYRPSIELSGDLYYWAQIDEHRFGLLLIDVMGHGVAAALISMAARSLAPGLIARVSDPGRVIQELNKHAVGLQPYYLTVFYLLIDTQARRMTYVNAGQPPGLMRTPQGIAELGRTTHPLGLLPQVDPRPQTIGYETPARLLLYTDGLIDLPNRSIRENMAAVKESFAQEVIPAEGFLPFILGETRKGHPGADDICLVSVALPGGA